MVHASMVGFAVAGAFLSVAYFDLPYNVMAMTAIALHLIANKVTTVGPVITSAAAVPTSMRPQTRYVPRGGPPPRPNRK
jgi:hypothetical protein